MKNVLFAIALLITLNSCTTSKHVTRDKETSSDQSESKEAIASKDKKEVKTDLKATIDTHTSENCDSNFLVPGSTLQGEKSLRDLLSDGNMNIESNTVGANIHYDSVSKTIHLVINEKARLFPVQFNKTTDTREVKDQQTNLNESSEASAVKNHKSSSESEKITVQKEVERTFPWWLIPVVVVMAVIVFVVVKEVHKRIL